MEATKWIPKVGDRVRYKPELRAYYEAPLLNGHAWARWVLDAVKPEGVIVTSTATRDWLHWGDQGGGASTHSMELVAAVGAPLPENAGRTPAPVEPRGFRVGDRVQLNARGREAWGDHMDHAWAREARDGCTVTGREGDLLVYGAGWGVHFDHVEHVPSAPVHSPPPPSGAVAEVCPFKVGDRVRIVGSECNGRTEGPITSMRPCSAWSGDTLVFVEDRIARWPKREGHVTVEAVDQKPAPSTKCPICRGPAVEMVTSIACLAAECEPWREPEPLVAEQWNHDHTETHWLATGSNVRVEHPIRETAIAEWRAKVEQGGRR